MTLAPTSAIAIIAVLAITLAPPVASAQQPEEGKAEQRTAEQATAEQRASPSTIAPAAADPAFEALPAALAAEAAAAHIRPATLQRAFAGLTRDLEVVALSKAQPEHERTAGQYVEAIVSADRIAAGRARLAALDASLAAIESRYGVDRHVLVAVWGIESNYGEAQGSRSVVRSLATMMLEDQRRPEFWRRELLAALRIIEQGDVEPSGLVGSWAGAMGHTQFMPSSYQRNAVDFDGDGRRDIWGSPVDALASAANYLASSGWMPGVPPVLEVVLADDFDFGLTEPGLEQPLSFWRDHGVAVPGGAPWPVLEPAGAGGTAPATGTSVATPIRLRLLLPAGARGPAFLVTRNFNAILRYNSAVPYALAVAHLADRLRGGGPIAASWPTERALVRAEREELQRRLVARNLDVGGVDGLIGSLTRTAIRSYQRQQGLLPDGYPGLDLLERLRAEPTGPHPDPQVTAGEAASESGLQSDHGQK